MQKDEQKLVKDKGCVYCKKLRTCKGKPRDVKLCVNFIERKPGEPCD